MAYNKLVSSFCSDPDNPFQVEAELKVRKALERMTAKIRGGYTTEFHRHEDQFDTDIVCYKYILYGNKYDKIISGKVEVEASPKWVNGRYPSKWKTYSYLRRKVEKWDKKTPEDLLDEVDIWFGEPWDDADTTIYLKVAQDLSDCHAALISDIWESNQKKLVIDKRSGLTQDRSHYFRTPYPNCNITKHGWDDVCEFMLSHFLSVEKNQAA